MNPGALYTLATCLFTWWVLGGTALAGQPGTEFVIVIDNSCSMLEPHTVKGATKPAADPERRAVLGALLVDGLANGTDDVVTVLTFPRYGKGGVLPVFGSDSIRQIGPSSGTFYKEPLAQAKHIFDVSQKDDKMLVFLSDGVPNDLERPEEGKALLGLPGGDFDTLVLGLFAHHDPIAESFMRPLARHPDDYVRVDDGATVVSHFTRGYGRALGSKALTGTLSPGSEFRIDVGKYVTEVLAVTTSVDRASQPYQAAFSAPKGPIQARATGDNGCTFSPKRNPGYCKPPRLHYAVWRAPHDPRQQDTWTLRVDKGETDVAWGVILRYDLTPRVELAELAKVGKPTPIRAHLEWNGEVFDDPTFFESDGFRVEAEIHGQTIPLEHRGGGEFVGEWTPDKARDPTVLVRFHNTWMEKRARAELDVEAPPPLTLAGEPIDFGAWQGSRRATRECQPLKLASNHPYDPARTAFDFEGVDGDVSVFVEEADEGLRVCARAKGCCSTTQSDGAFLIVTATDPDDSTATARIPLSYQVTGPGLLTCWWPWLLALLILALVLWFLYGWIRPHDFDEDLTIRVAGSERQLSRSASLVLREQPRGRRGFYRNARIAITHAGDFVAQPKRAAVWVEATGRDDTTIHLRGPLEIKDRRTRKWVPVEPEEANDGIRTNVVYRLGDIYFRFQ